MVKTRSSEKEPDNSDTTMHGGSPLNHVEETGQASGSGMASGSSTTRASGSTVTPAPVIGSNVTTSSSNTTVQSAPSVLPVNNPPHYQFQMPVKKIY